MRAIVVGGTGLVGRALLRELANDSRYTSVTSLARRTHDAPARVQVHVGLDEVPEADVAFCALGTTMATAGSKEAFRAVDHGLVLDFATRCRERGVRSFHVVSALGANAAARGFYNRVKGEMERDVRAVGFPAVCIYRPSLLLADREEKRPAERAGIVLMRALDPIIPQAWRGIPPEIVARAMARHAAGAPDGWHVHESRELWTLAAG